MFYDNQPNFESVLERVCYERKYVTIPPGRYNVSRPINIPSGSFISGSGEDTIITIASGVDRGFNIENRKDVSFSNFSLDATSQYSTATRNNFGFWVNNTENFFAQNITANFGAFGFFIVNNSTANRTRNIEIKNCKLSGLGSNDLIGGGAFSSNGSWVVEDITISNNIITQDITNSVWDYTGCIAIVNVKNTLFHNNTCRGIVVFSVEQSPHRESSIVGNRISGAIGRTSGKLYVNFHDRATQDLMPRNLFINKNYVNGTVSITRESLVSLNLPQEQWLNGESLIFTENIIDCNGVLAQDKLPNSSAVNINRFNGVIFSDNILKRTNITGNQITTALRLDSTTNSVWVKENMFQGFSGDPIINNSATNWLENNKVF